MDQVGLNRSDRLPVVTCHNSVLLEGSERAPRNPPGAHTCAVVY